MKLNVEQLEDHYLVFVKGGNSRDYDWGEKAGNVVGWVVTAGLPFNKLRKFKKVKKFFKLF